MEWWAMYLNGCWCSSQAPPKQDWWITRSSTQVKPRRSAAFWKRFSGGATKPILMLRMGVRVDAHVIYPRLTWPGSYRVFGLCWASPLRPILGQPPYRAGCRAVPPGCHTGDVEHLDGALPIPCVLLDGP